MAGCTHDEVKVSWSPNIAVAVGQQRAHRAIGWHGVGVRANSQQTVTTIVVTAYFAAQIVRILRGVLRGVQAVVCVLPKVYFGVGNWILMRVQHAPMQPNPLTFTSS